MLNKRWIYEVFIFLVMILIVFALTDSLEIVLNLMLINLSRTDILKELFNLLLNVSALFLLSRILLNTKTENKL